MLRNVPEPSAAQCEQFCEEIEMEDAKREEKRRHLALLDAAMAEFQEKGRVISVTCDVCGTPIEITAIGDEAWSVRCRCGKFNDTLRGL